MVFVVDATVIVVDGAVFVAGETVFAMDGAVFAAEPPARRPPTRRPRYVFAAFR